MTAHEGGIRGTAREVKYFDARRRQSSQRHAFSAFLEARHAIKGGDNVGLESGMACGQPSAEMRSKLIFREPSCSLIMRQKSPYITLARHRRLISHGEVGRAARQPSGAVLSPRARKMHFSASKSLSRRRLASASSAVSAGPAYLWRKWRGASCRDGKETSLFAVPIIGGRAARACGGIAGAAPAARNKLRAYAREINVARWHCAACGRREAGILPLGR